MSESFGNVLGDSKLIFSIFFDLSNKAWCFGHAYLAQNIYMCASTINFNAPRSKAAPECELNLIMNVFVSGESVISNARRRVSK